MNTLQQLIYFYSSINAACKRTGESTVAMDNSPSSLSYYQAQNDCLLEDACISQELANQFIAWLHTQPSNEYKKS